MTKQFYEAWRWLITPSKAITDPEERRRAELFSTFLVILICLLGILLIMLLILTGLEIIELEPGAVFPSIRETAIILGVACLIYLLGRTRYNTFSIALSVLLITGRILADALSGQPHFHYLFAPILVVIFFSLVFSVKWTAVIASMGLILLAVVGLLVPEATFDMIIPMMFVHIVGSSFILVGVGHRDWQHNRIQRQALALREQNEALLQTNKELLVTRKQAEEANRLKEQFLSTISHELRTPLHAIMGYSQILLEGFSGDLTPEQRQSQERIFDNAVALVGLVDNILEISRIEAGRMDLNRFPFTLRDWVRDTAAQAQTQALEKGLDFQVMIDEHMPEALIEDEKGLKQIVANLLDNAVKFTEVGSVKLAIQRQGENTWCISVSDTGIGIPVEAHEYIFEEFRQVDGSIRREHGGMGLGLSIARHLVKVMDGQITVESGVGVGSIFTVTLPLITEDMAASATLDELISSAWDEAASG